MFGFLELEEDLEALRALLDAAAGWLRERGRDRMVGPMDFTMNDESGVLIEGFERRADDPPGLASALLPASLRGGRAREGGGHVHVVAAHLGPREGDADHLGPRRAARAEARDPHPQDEPPAPPARPRRLRRDLQRGLGAQLRVRAVLEGGPRRVRPGAPDRLRQGLVHDRRGRRGQDRGDGDHGAGRQPGAEEDERAAAAARLVALPEPAPDHRPLPRGLPRA